MLELQRASLEIAKQLENNQQNLACALMRKEYEVVLDALSEALILSETSGDVLLRSSVLSLMALAHLERGDFERAFEAAQQALEQAQSGSERLDQMRARVIFVRAELGVSATEGRVRTATEALEGVLKEALLTGSSAVEVFALEHLDGCVARFRAIRASARVRPSFYSCYSKAVDKNGQPF